MPLENYRFPDKALTVWFKWQSKLQKILFFYWIFCRTILFFTKSFYHHLVFRFLVKDIQKKKFVRAFASLLEVECRPLTNNLHATILVNTFYFSHLSTLCPHFVWSSFRQPMVVPSIHIILAYCYSMALLPETSSFFIVRRVLNS